MLRFERKLIEWINRYMLHIAVCFVLAAAVLIRGAGRNYIGNDYHYSLYDVPGNCNSLLYRGLVELLMSRTDHVIAAMKMISYVGDFLTAFFALVLFRRKEEGLLGLRNFLIITSFLLSPVALIYSVGGMEIDSVCMSGLLCGLWLARRGRSVLAAFVLASAAFLYPIYWPVVLMVLINIEIRMSKTRHLTLHEALAVVLLAGCFVLYIVAENIGGLFWGKIFVIDPSIGIGYDGLRAWLSGMCRLYGYAAATGCLLAAMEHRRMRIPALVLQVLVVMYVGWQQTGFLAV